MECHNWDKSSWLSSDDYFSKLVDQITTHVSIGATDQLLDIGCGRGYLLKKLIQKVDFKLKPIGIDSVDHQNEFAQELIFVNRNALKEMLVVNFLGSYIE